MHKGSMGQRTGDLETNRHRESRKLGEGNLGTVMYMFDRVSEARGPNSALPKRSLLGTITCFK